MKQRNGFTLVELIVTLAVISVVTAMGLPMFERMITNSRLTSQSNDFISALLYARTEAVKRGTRVTLCKSASGTACTTSGYWSKGWIVFSDTGTVATVDGNDTVLRRGVSLPEVFSFSGSANVADYVSYIPTGRTQMADGTAQSGTLTLSHAHLSDLDRRISISRTGRARVQD